MKRREFLKATGALGAAAAVGMSGLARAAETPPAAKPKGMPMITLGGLAVSRLILGSNPFWGYSHKNPQLDEEMKQYHTDEVITKILDEAAACGVTACASPPVKRWLDLWPKYQAGGGKLKTWISQCDCNPEQMLADIEASVKTGAKAVFIQGGRVEEQFARKKFDTLRAWADRIKELGVPAGFAAHWPEVHPEIQRQKFPLDFYYQCFYNVSKGATFLPPEREKAVETLRQLEKPVIGYKILAAGRLAPNEGFEYALAHIRKKDGVCVGIYAKTAIDQIRQNATFTEELSNM